MAVVDDYPIRAAAGNVSTTTTFGGRDLAPELASVGQSLFGVGRTSGGTFVTSVIDARRVAIFDESSPTA